MSHAPPNIENIVTRFVMFGDRENIKITPRAGVEPTALLCITFGR